MEPELGSRVSSGAYVSTLSDLPEDFEYEPTMGHVFGIGAHCGANDINMHLAYLEPTKATRAHYHRVSDIAAYVLEGACTLVTWDRDNTRCEQHISKGDFIYVPRGVPHKMINPSHDERFALVACYNNAGTGEATDKYFVE